jgi:thioredoxin-dependent peroxiredoxin
MIETGQKAPELNINDQNGTLRTISEFKGKKLVLYFYPKDDTPGCTAEACDLRDNYSRFLSEGYAILGVSPDTEAKHQKFIAKYELPFDLLADTEHTVAIAFGVWVEKSMYGKQYMGIARKTFIINENGLIETVIDKVNTKAHTAQIL